MRSTWIRPILLLTLVSLTPLGARAGTWVWKEYEANHARILELSTLQGQKSQEVVARFGRNDTPEALAILGPIREELKAARAKEAQLLCRDRPKVENPAAFFEQMNLPLKKRRLDHDRLMGFVKRMVRSGTLSPEQGRRLRFTLGHAGHGVMNPSSRGAGQVHQRIAQALRCYGLDKYRARPGDAGPRPRTQASGKTPSPEAATLRYFRSCGDNVCRTDGYRGPFPEVPACQKQKVGDRCSRAGETCDLENHCNMMLVCAARDPSTRCAR